MISTVPLQQPPTIKHRLLLDVTISATTDLNTGIQRVVRNITKNAESISKELGVECVPVVCHGDQLSPVGFDGRARLDERIFRFLRDGWMGCHKGIASLLSRLNSKAGPGYLSVLSRLRKLLVPKTLVRATGNFYRRVTGQTIQFEEDDVLVLLDASWDLPLDHLIQQAKEKQVPVVTVVYDLIPVMHPQFHHQQLRDVFVSWLEKVIENSSLMIGISQTVQNDLADYIRDQNGLKFKALEDQSDAGCQLAHFRLGSDFAKAEQKPNGKESPFQDENATGLNPSKYFLAVGTLEPRKNHEYLLDAFEQLWAKGSDCQLAIVGKVGWMCEKVFDRIRYHAQLNRRLFYFDNASDSQLNQLYRNARALVFPSIVEGFGLPIVEAFQHQIPVLASDTRIHREVAGDEAIFFELDDPANLSSLIEDIESGSRKLLIPEQPSTSWSESCREFLGKICNFIASDSADVISTEEQTERRLAA